MSKLIRPDPIVIPISVQGYFKFEAINYFSGVKRTLADWFPNKILDQGRNYIGSNSGWLNHCQVGTDSTPPTASDTAIGGYVAGTSQIESDLYDAQATAPYYGYRRRRYRFAVGTTAANLSEAGVGWASTSGSNLFTRALIVDGNGDPTTVTPLADEILDVTYELRYYPPLTDVTGTITLDGTVYDTIVRACAVNSASEQGQPIGSEVDPYALGGGWGGWGAFDGNIGTLIQSPSGTGAGLQSGQTPSSVTYSNNSYQKEVYVNSGQSGWVLGAGIRSVKITTTLGSFQTQFDAQGTGNTIPKTGANDLQLRWMLSWAEKT